MTDELLPDSPEVRELSCPQWTERPPVDERTPVSQAAVPDLNALKELDCTNPDLLRPTLAALLEGYADLFDPVRFRFIEALAQKALKQRSPVAQVLEKKALQALLEYLDAYVPAREHTASLVARMASETPETADQIGRLFDAGNFKGVEQLAAQTGGHDKEKQGVLAALTQEMLQPDESGEFASKSSFEDELRQQERAFMQSVTGVTAGNVVGAGAQQGQNSSGELSAMRYFRESLVQRNSERRVAGAIKGGPENPGPLNAHALIIRSLSMMRDLSPSYTNRLVSYMESLLWLEQAGAAVTPAKSKRTRRRKS
jgi:hypothetical protein